MKNKNIKEIANQELERMKNKSIKLPKKMPIGKTLSICPYCHNFGILVPIKNSWICEECLNLVKKEGDIE